MLEVENAKCTCTCEPYSKTNKKIYTFPDSFINKSLTLIFNVKYADKEFFKIKDNKE